MLDSLLSEFEYGAAIFPPDLVVVQLDMYLGSFWSLVLLVDDQRVRRVGEEGNLFREAGVLFWEHKGVSHDDRIEHRP